MVYHEYRKHSEAPPPSLWLFDLANQQSTRLVIPRKLSVSAACWLDNNNILFETDDDLDEPGPKSAIYRMSLDEKNLKRLITNAWSVTARTP